MKSEADNSFFGEKNLRTNFGNIGHSIAIVFGKTFFHKGFVL